MTVVCHDSSGLESSITKALVAKLVRRVTSNDEILGSTPSPSCKFFAPVLGFVDRGLRICHSYLSGNTRGTLLTKLATAEMHELEENYKTL